MLKKYNLSKESEERLSDIIQEINEGNKSFYDCLQYDEEQVINEGGLKHALYLLTDNDQITRTGYYENINIPYFLNEGDNNSELKEYLDDLPVHCDINCTYWHTKFNKAIVIDQIYNDGDWELEGAEVLYSLFDFNEYSDAEELAEELKLGNYYYNDNIQVNYIIKYDDIENAINNDEHLYNNREKIIELIQRLSNYDDRNFEDFKDNILNMEAV